jgi:UDPglucose 6-dehydrogenase
MSIGFMGLGKLGLPCALAIESKGHKVVGYDPDPNVAKYIEQRAIPYREVGAPELLACTNIKVKSIKEVVEESDIIFVPIQTPHQPKYEGITRIPESRVDFDYTYLKTGIRELSAEIEQQKDVKIVIIISTVLPGTIRKEIMSLVGEHMRLCYNPFFIAMGTTIRDFLNPEFVLFGRDSGWVEGKAADFYRTIHDKPIVSMSIESAELTKVAYNTIITSKITIANTLMEICHKIPGANVDDVVSALKLATERIVSPKYMNAGMGDGGGCHPRDNIALSWLARKLDLSHDIYDNLMKAREHQTDWLVDLIMDTVSKYGFRLLPVYILGKSFKPETDLTVGSPAILLKNLLEERGLKPEMWDPHVDGNGLTWRKPHIYFIATQHKQFTRINFPDGSVVIDPFRYIPKREGVKIIGIGE